MGVVPVYVQGILKDIDLLTYLTYIFNMDIFNNISIVIPSYNEENYIYNTLWSINRQEVKIRVYVADGGSTDSTLEIVEKAKQDFPNLIIEVIEGGAVAVGRNNGSRLVETPYILFMDADSVLLGDDILTQTFKYSTQYDIITCKQKSITRNDKKSIWTYRIFNWVRRVMPETFCTGCYFFISKNKFVELGGFDESLNNSEDFWLSRQVPKKRFKIIDRYVGQDNRRFKKMGYWSFIKIVLLNYWYKNNINWFKKDVGYWEPYN